MIPVANVSAFYAKVREFYVYMVSRHTVHLQVLERSLLLLKPIVNMLALYIKAIEEVLLYLRALVTWGKLKKNVLIFKVMTHSEWSKWAKYIYLYSYNQRSTSFVHVEDVLR